jgi:hypothetical protein
MTQSTIANFLNQKSLRPVIQTGVRSQVTKTFGLLIDQRLKAINGLFLGNKGRGVVKYLFMILDVLRLHRTVSDVKLLVTFAF